LNRVNGLVRSGFHEQDVVRLAGQPALPPTAFEIGYTARTVLRVPFAEAAVMRFADTRPTRRIRARKGTGVAPSLRSILRLYVQVKAALAGIFG
jgi:hypothetical protein